MYKIEINALPPSLNQFYAGLHWAKRKEIVDTWHGLFRGAFIDAKLPRKLETPIILNITQFCKRTVRDADNAVVSAKLAGDSLKLFGYIPDDSPKYISTVILQSKKGKEDKTVVVICPDNRT